MGKKKKFIDKKKSATFQLLARDSSDPNYDETPGSERVFVRVDNNPVAAEAVFQGDNHQHDQEIPYYDDSRFDDAPDDDNDGEDCHRLIGSSTRVSTTETGRLPEQVRREILELGFPDDGYNYLLHLREIKNTGGGSVFYHNPKFKLDQLPRDVKAYDASRLRISEAKEDQSENSIYSVASKTVNVRVQKAVDPEVVALLDDSDASRFGSDVEDLEEDFVVIANMPEEREGDDVVSDRKLNLVQESEILVNEGNSKTSHSGNQEVVEVINHRVEEKEKPRARRLLDEQFDKLELQEYGSGDDDCDYDGCEDEGEEVLAEKLKNVLNDHSMEDLELDDKYVGPADLLKANERPISKESLDNAADILRRCAEYAKKYENGSEDDKVAVVEESSDESEQWDCETIISTYSNLDNHPGKIGAPAIARRKKLVEAVFGSLSATSPVISLRGKEKLPVDHLPHSKKTAADKVTGVGGSNTEQLKRRPHGHETKEEKKERKAAVKEERREARKVKKEMKGLYRCEAQRAQKVAAITGPSSIHLM
ncbi:hypothetical protein SLEP1_g4092 [Rubroshorea leprosula]|uniref:Protein LTV1 homolog n=1 Tax=Rubroshorea leprosula TaxID=152421 RepID=A0AAV5HTC4_9ROSI|nr:hypothetical protein SLEP1_g4092 [Rubroshorea leprosula]